MNSGDRFNSNENNTGRGRGASSTFNVGRSTSRGGFGGYSAGNGGNARDRSSISGGGQFNRTMQNIPLVQRIVTNEVVNPKALTSLFKQCRTFGDLKNLYNGQKDKHYYNYIHASACFSQAIKLFTAFDGHKPITQEELTVFRDNVFLYSEEFNPQALANLSNNAWKLLDYAQKKHFQGAKELEKLAYETLSNVFQVVASRENLEEFNPQALANLSNNAWKLLNYAQNKYLQGAEELEKLAYETLLNVFHAVASRENLEEFNAQDLASLSNNAGKLLDYAQKKHLQGAEELEKLAYETLSNVFHAVVSRENLEEFNSQDFANLANNAGKLLDYAQNKYLQGAEGLEKLAYETLSKVFHAVASLENLEEFNPQELANLANNAGKLLDYAQNKDFQGAKGLEKLAYETLSNVFCTVIRRENLEEFNPQELANLANNAGKLLNYAQNKYFQGAEELEKLAYEMLSKVFHAVASLENLEKFNSQDFANLANTLVRAGCWNDMTSDLLFKTGKAVCERNFNTFTIQGICNLSWSLSIGKQLSLIYDSLIEGLSKLNEQQLNELVTESAQQLYMAFLRKALDDRKWDKEHPNAFLASYLNQTLVQRILQEVNEEVSKKDIKISQLQKSVESVLKRILPEGYSLKEEYYIKPYPVDFAIFKDMGNGKDKQLIALIEVNGPTHFMRNGIYSLVHEFKETILKDMGYGPIININYMEWDKSVDQENLLKGELSQLFELNNKDDRLDIDDVNEEGELSRFYEFANKKISEKAEDRVAVETEAEMPIVTKERVKNKLLKSTVGQEPVFVDTSNKKKEIAVSAPFSSKEKVKDKSGVREKESGTLGNKQGQIAKNFKKDTVTTIGTHNSKKQITGNARSTNSKKKVQNEINVDKTKRNLIVSKKEKSAKTVKSERVNGLTIMDTIRFNATSMPAMMLYVILFMLTINTLRHSNSEKI